MAHRNGNYSAFYVDGDISETNLGAHAKKDFVSYSMLRAWKGRDASFPFNDSHKKNYTVRDDSDWESTLKPRLRDRINNSKNLILFLSSSTKNSRALREEIEYAINKGLPIIVIYPEFKEKDAVINCSRAALEKLWDKLPAFRNLMGKVPTLHIPMNKNLIERGLNNGDFMVNTKKAAGIYLRP